MKSIKSIKLFISLSLLTALYFTQICFAATHYVSPTGTAMWANSTRIATPCSLATASASAVAGDVVYLRGGAYTWTGGTLTSPINPSHSGTASDNMITFQAYTASTWDNREVPIITSSDNAVRHYGVFIKQRNYIKVSGIEFQDFQYWGTTQSGNYNEISYCKFYNSANSGSVGFYIWNGGSKANALSSHNWFHHNVLHRLSTTNMTACVEGADIVRIGTSVHDEVSHNNTIEDNELYYAGHTVTEDFGVYNVWRNNVAHNEGYRDTSQLVLYGTATGGATGKLIDTSRNFATTTPPAVVGKQVVNFTEPMKRGTVISISTTTNINDTLNLSAGIFGNVTFSNGMGYAVTGCNYAPDPAGAYPGNAKYAHRVFSMTSTDNSLYKYSLFEGNRAGYAAINANNNGADNLTLGSPGNIVRYNAFFGADGPGINLKGYGGGDNYAGARNRIYNNTIYGNGRYTTGSINPAVKVGIEQYSRYSVGNQIKNNLFYQNGGADLGGPVFSYGAQTWTNNWCNYNADGCSIKTGDPLFIDYTLDDYANVATKPDLRLRSGSAAINAGTYLTTAVGEGSRSISLIVSDALYFQDGTWGSDLTRTASTMQADWIAIGVTDNVVKIMSINYGTNTITLASPMTWSDGAKIWLYKKSDGAQVLYGSAPDIGAYEYFEGSSSGSAPAPMNSIENKK